MADDETLRLIVRFILERATGEDLEIIDAAVRKRTGRRGAPGATGPETLSDIVRDVAGSISDQLEEKLDVHAMTRRVVAQLIKQNEPNISERDLQALLEVWVPDTAARRKESGGRSIQDRLPKDAVLAMIRRFVSYSLGTMPESEKRELPEGWADQYWNVFSDETQDTIAALLKGDLEPAAFWRAVGGESSGGADTGADPTSDGSASGPADADPAADG